MVIGEEESNTFLTDSIKSGPGTNHCDGYQRQSYILKCYPFYLRVKNQHHFLKWLFRGQMIQLVEPKEEEKGYR